MKQVLILLTTCLLLNVSALAATPESFFYESQNHGFTILVPSISAEEIIVEETDTSVKFYHAPSHEKYGGEIGSIEVVSPREDFFSKHYDNMVYQIIAMGENQVFLWKSPGGGAHTGGEFLDAFKRVSSAFSMEDLRKGLVPTQPDGWPKLQTTRHLAYMPANNGLARPNEPMTRGDLAQMLYILLDAGNKADSYQSPFLDTTGKDCTQAVAYLASYGIVSGYADRTFRPDEPVSRAAFAVLLHRCQFAAPVEKYGEELIKFVDVPVGHWAQKYIYSAGILGWLRGSADGLFYPEREITRAEAVTAINRMLGRDEFATDTSSISNPFSDLPDNHWAYANILEATGVLRDVSFAPQLKDFDMPEKLSTYYLSSKTDGWVALEGQIFHTTDGGESWNKVGDPFTFTISGLFFNGQNGILLGHSKEKSCILLRTVDGAKTWDDLLANPNTWANYLPAEQFPTEKSLMDSIVSAVLRPANKTDVYLTIRYCPYESIYVYDFEAAKQVLIATSK